MVRGCRYIGGVQEDSGPVPLVVYIICPSFTAAELKQYHRAAERLLGDAPPSDQPIQVPAIAKPSGKMEGGQPVMMPSQDSSDGEPSGFRKYGTISLTNQYAPLPQQGAFKKLDSPNAKRHLAPIMFQVKESLKALATCIAHIGSICYRAYSFSCFCVMSRS
jgi:hypothetical protein